MRPLTTGDPRELGPYRLSALLGAGGMGRVYLGTAPDGTAAAVKAVRAEYAYDPGFRERFARELDLARQVRGDFTPRVLDADPAGTPPWMATEYVAGPTLHDLVRQAGPLPEDAARFLARGIAAALARVHGQGIVHHDLKPGNVMASPAGPQVIDFGVARALEQDRGDEEPTAAGTPGYMAPEQVEGAATTAATDVFALGGVLVYALTGTGPFSDGHPAAVLYRITHQEPALDGVPEGLRGLIADCLSREPGARPTAARILQQLGGAVHPAEHARAWLPERAAALVDAAAEETRQDTARPGAPARRPAGEAPRGRRRLLAAGAGALALTLTAGVGAWAALRADTPRTQEAPGGEAEGAPGGAGGCDLPADLAPEYTEAARPDPRVPGADTHDQDVHSYPSLTFLQGGDLLALTHPEGVALWDTETGKEAAYIGADLPDFAQTPVISQDGCRLGYASEEGGVHVFDLRTGEHTGYAEDLPLPAGAVAFSPDGTTLALAEGATGGGAHLIDLAGGKATTVVEGATQLPAHSPDGARLAVTGPEATAVVDTANGDEVFRGPAATASSPNALALPAPDLLFYLHEEGIVRADLSSGEEPRVIAPPDAEDRFGEIAVPPGGDRIHALIDGYDDETGDYRPELTVWDADTGDRLPAGEDPRYVRGIAVHPEGTVVAGLNPEGTSVLLLDPETLDATAELG